jgi:hypothetical protein
MGGISAKNSTPVKMLAGKRAYLKGAKKLVCA